MAQRAELSRDIKKISFSVYLIEIDVFVKMDIVLNKKNDVNI
jgi:hypothetical protein